MGNRRWFCRDPDDALFHRDATWPRRGRRENRGSGGGRTWFGEAPEAAVDEGAEVPAVEVFEGSLAGSVVAVGEAFRYVVDFEPVEDFEDVEGVRERKGEVVARVDDQGAFRRRGE